MLVARVVRDEIEHHADAALRRLAHELLGVGQRAERGIDRAVVGDVVAPVLVGRQHDRIEPDALDAEPLQMVEAGGDPAQVADAVGVRVHVGAGIDLVEHAVAPPRAPRLVSRHLGHAAEPTRPGWRRQVAAAVAGAWLAFGGGPHARVLRVAREELVVAAVLDDADRRRPRRCGRRGARSAAGARSGSSCGPARRRPSRPAPSPRSGGRGSTSLRRGAGSRDPPDGPGPSAISWRCPDDNERPRSLTHCR